MFHGTILHIDDVKMNAKPTVAVVSYFFPHYRSALIRELVKRSSYFFVFVGDTVNPFDSGIVPCDCIDSSRFLASKCWRCFPNGSITIQSGILRLALRSDIKAIIYTGDPLALSTWVSAAVARLSGKRVLFWTHGWYKDKSGPREWIKRAFFSLANGLLLYGNRAKAIGETKGFSSSDLYVIYNSLDTQKQIEIRSKVSVESIKACRQELFGHWDTPVVICTSRLVGVRRLDLLLDAASILKSEGRSVDIVIVGDGPERSRLEHHSAANGLSVVFYGECYNEETLAVLIMSANVFVVPGRIGLAAMHALIYGTPVITHNDPDDQFPEWEAVIPGVNGAHFSKGDPADLARAIRTWTENILPQETIRQKCAQIIESYYNPLNQVLVFDAAVAGRSADDVALSELSEQSKVP